MNDHFLKERYKDLTTDELTAVLNNNLMFDPFNTEYRFIQEEVKRREQENEQPVDKRKIEDVDHGR